MSNYSLVQGDCLQVMAGMEAGSVDLIVTDPPYFKVKDEPWDRQWETSAGFLAWLDTVLVEFARILKPNGSLYLFASPKMAARVEVLIGQRFNVLNRICWAKHDGTQNEGGLWSRADKDILRRFFEQKEEIIFAEHFNSDNYAQDGSGYDAECDKLRGFVFEPLRAYLDGERQRAGVSKAAANKLFDGPNVGQYWWQVRNFQLPTAENYEILRAGLSRLNHGGEYLRREYEDLRREYEDLRRPFNVTADVPYTDVWTFPTVGTYPGKHVCEKPLEMMRHIVEASSRPGDLVLDCFVGSGNSGIAATMAGRKFVGIDLSPHWVEVTRQRIGKAAGEFVTKAGSAADTDGLPMFATEDVA
jgi:site-specific DNA-methyltransferase (adenine-specific)